MNAQMTIDSADPAGKWLYRVGGIAALVLGLGYVIIFPLFAQVGAPPTGGDAWLAYLPGKTTVWWAILGLSVFTDLLYVPVALSLYVALRRVDRYLMLLAAAFVGVFVTLDLAVTWTNYAALLKLSDLHAAAANDVQRAGYVAAAQYASAVLASPAEVVCAIVDLSLGILMIGLVMLKGAGIFSRVTAYLGLATGVLGILSLAGLFVTVILNAVLATVWLFFVGFRLLRLGRQ